MNSAGAALLYKLAGDLAAPTPNDVLLDLFCGCGSFGIALARLCKHVVGIDSNAASVRGAAAVAEAHELRNCDFVAGTVEAELAGVLRRPVVAEAQNVIAIVDPPRGGALLLVAPLRLRFRPNLP